MPIENSCERYKGALVFVLPTSGYGWCRKLADSPRYNHGKPEDPPKPFHLRIVEFHYFLGEIRACVGSIEETNHPLDKEWLACCVRDGGGAFSHNFTTHPAEYNVCIGMRMPAIKIDPENLAMPEWMQFGDASHLSGFGYIVDSVSTLEEILERNRK